jgi:hypothetical protein
MTYSNTLPPEYARRLMVADAQHVVASIAGALGQAKMRGHDERIPDLEKRLEDARTRLFLAKAAAA